jgi:hypothetical protein
MISQLVPYKKCCICEKNKPATIKYFHRRSSSEDGLRRDCKICRKTKLKNGFVILKTRKCSKCDKEKPNTTEYFNIRNFGKSQRTRSICRECSKEYSIKRHYIKNYNLTKEDIEKLKYEQKNSCAICKTTLIKLVVDHDHETNIVRGLLCDRCNTGIGSLKEDLNILNKAIEYLKKWK